jgi:hypothetical protein
MNDPAHGRAERSALRLFLATIARIAPADPMSGYSRLAGAFRYSQHAENRIRRKARRINYLFSYSQHLAMLHFRPDLRFFSGH